MKRFALFIGHPRQSHTIVGAMLNAHPRIVIANHFNVLAEFDRYPQKEDLEWAMLQKDRKFVRKGQQQAGYEYSLPGWYQGSYTRLNILGDKKGSGTTDILGESPDALDHLQAKIGVPLSLIHVTRNPWDHIPTIARLDTNGDVDAAIRLYEKKARIIEETRKRKEYDLIELSSEEYCKNTRKEHRRLVEALGETCPEGYRDDVNRKVMNEPKKRRGEVTWNEERTQRVRSFIARFDFLKKYAL